MKTVITAVLTFASITAFAVIPDEQDLRVVPQFPQPASTAFGVTGAALSDGRFILWNGDDVFIQNVGGGSVFDLVASGYLGDPGFLRISPDGSFALLGAGFGDGTNANVYTLNLTSPQDFVPGNEIVVPSHFSGDFLDANLVAFDRGDFGVPAEIIVLDLFGTVRGLRRTASVMQLPPASASRNTIITKPAGSFSASLLVDGGVMYVADAGNGQYKSFPVTDIITAFNAMATVNWSAGTDIGGPFDFPTNGIAGITAGGNFVMPGFGAVVEVDSTTETVVKSIAPGGGAAFYGAIFNPVTDELVVIEFPAGFGDPLVFHATANAIAGLPAADIGSLLITMICIGIGATLLSGPAARQRFRRP